MIPLEISRFERDKLMIHLFYLCANFVSDLAFLS